MHDDINELIDRAVQAAVKQNDEKWRRWLVKAWRVKLRAAKKRWEKEQMGVGQQSVKDRYGNMCNLCVDDDITSES